MGQRIRISLRNNLASSEPGTVTVFDEISTDYALRALLREGKPPSSRLHDGPNKTLKLSCLEARSPQVGNEPFALGADQGHPQRNSVSQGWSIAATLSTAFSPGAAIANVEHCPSRSLRDFSETFVVSAVCRSYSEPTQNSPTAPLHCRHQQRLSLRSPR